MGQGAAWAALGVASLLLAGAPPLAAQVEAENPPKEVEAALRSIPTVATMRMAGLYIYMNTTPVCGPFTTYGAGDPPVTVVVERNTPQKVQFEMPFYANWTHFGTWGEPIVGGSIGLGGSTDPDPGVNVGNNVWWTRAHTVPGNTPADHMMKAWAVFSISSVQELTLTATGLVQFKDPYDLESQPCSATSHASVTIR